MARGPRDHSRGVVVPVETGEVENERAAAMSEAKSNRLPRNSTFPERAVWAVLSRSAAQSL